MEVDRDDRSLPSTYLIRARADGLKKIRVDGETFPDDSILSFPPDLLSAICPLFPAHDNWNYGHVHRDQQSQEVRMDVGTYKQRYVQTEWHDTKVDECDLSERVVLCPKVYQVKYLGSDAVYKMAGWDEEVERLERETSIYEAIQDYDIGPRFLGHVTVGGGVIGLLLEKLVGRPAVVEDEDACRRLLQRLHRLRILHGDLNPFNFIVTKNGPKLIDFETSKEQANEGELAAEMKSLRGQLEEATGRGGLALVDDEGSQLGVQAA